MFFQEFILLIIFLLDEKLVLRLFGKESGAKVEGLEAALAGAVASMLAQILTTPVLNTNI